MTLPAKADDTRILDIQEFTSESGVDFWLVEDHTLPIITMNFAFRGAGSINDPTGKDGLGQLLSNVLDEGAGERDAQAFQQALQDHAIDLSFSNSRDHFTGKIKTLSKHQDLAFGLLKDALTSPRFEEEAISRMENANIMRIKSSQSNMDWAAARLMNATYFGDHTYARNSGGTISGLKSITVEDLKNYHQEFLTRNRLVIAVAGDITPALAKTLVDRIFGSIPTGQNPDALDRISAPEKNLKKAFRTQSPQSVVHMVWPSLPKSDPDYHAYRVLNHLLGAGGFSSELMEEVREKRGLTYGIYSRPVHMDYADYLAIEAATSPENVVPMMTAVTDVINGFKNKPVDDEKLADAKSYLIGSLPLRFSSTQRLSSVPLSMQLDNLPITMLDDWTDNINAVTSADIKHVARRIFETAEPKAKVVAGAVPEGIDFEMVETLPGVE